MNDRLRLGRESELSGGDALAINTRNSARVGRDACAAAADMTRGWRLGGGKMQKSTLYNPKERGHI
jgi:hypothetical protein